MSLNQLFNKWEIRFLLGFLVCFVLGFSLGCLYGSPEPLRLLVGGLGIAIILSCSFLILLIFSAWIWEEYTTWKYGKKELRKAIELYMINERKERNKKKK